MTKHEIIDETVAYYSEDPKRRAFNGSDCMYFIPESGNMCAVGRCLKNPSDLIGKTINADDLLEGNDSLLKLEYQGHDARFWQDLQWLHDRKEFWCESGLTVAGKNEVIGMKSKWKD